MVLLQPPYSTTQTVSIAEKIGLTIDIWEKIQDKNRALFDSIKEKNIDELDALDFFRKKKELQEEEYSYYMFIGDSREQFKEFLDLFLVELPEDALRIYNHEIEHANKCEEKGFKPRFGVRFPVYSDDGRVDWGGLGFFTATDALDRAINENWSIEKYARFLIYTNDITDPSLYDKNTSNFWKEFLNRNLKKSEN